jgi:hypothetical protein
MSGGEIQIYSIMFNIHSLLPLNHSIGILSKKRVSNKFIHLATIISKTFYLLQRSGVKNYRTARRLQDLAP